MSKKPKPNDKFVAEFDSITDADGNVIDTSEPAEKKPKTPVKKSDFARMLRPGKTEDKKK